MKTVKYGIIGLGNMGSGHIASFFKEGNVPNAEVVAIADRKPEKVQRICDKYPQAKFDCYAEGADLIDKADEIGRAHV